MNYYIKLWIVRKQVTLGSIRSSINMAFQEKFEDKQYSVSI